MTEPTANQSSIELIEKKFNKNWPHIRAARDAAISKREETIKVLGSTGINFLSND
jgi:hypothetical protein